MKMKLLKLAAFGFVLGMAVGNLIAIISTTLISGETIVFSDALLAKAGSPAAALTLQTLFSGVLGAIAMGGVILYDVESLGLLATAALHYAIIMAAYFPIAINLGWIDVTFTYIAVMTLIMAAAYAVIWLIMYARYRAEVRELNQLLEKA